MASFRETGVLSREELAGRLPPEGRLRQGACAVIECVEEIPCNPCAAVCRSGAIIKEGLCKPPVVDWKACIGCTMCVAACPGMAIFMQWIEDGDGYVTMPYELLPEPKIGDRVQLLNRKGEAVGEGMIVNPTYKARGDAYPRWVVTVKMDDPDLSYEVRAFKILE